ncbi:hypothetical protein LSAT2_010005 [Lamellibrachia satsuma]|nr:hypothetical protein LSAT2_010005 [Lamellibrachia satsuma]
MQTKAATLHFNAVKTCFIALPKTLTTLTFARDKGSIFQLQSDTASLFVSWSGDVTMVPPGGQDEDIVELNGLMANKAGFRHGQQVMLTAVPATVVPSCESLFLEPLSVDDWEILELNTSTVENRLLDQVRVVATGQTFPIWIQGSMCIFVRVGQLSVTAKCVLLERRTQLVVSRKVRHHRPFVPPGGENSVSLGNSAMESSSVKQEGIMARCFNYIKSFNIGEQSTGQQVEPPVQDPFIDRIRPGNLSDDFEITLRVQPIIEPDCVIESCPSPRQPEDNSEEQRKDEFIWQMANVRIGIETLAQCCDLKFDGGAIPAFPAVLSKLPSPSDKEMAMKEHLSRSRVKLGRNEKNEAAREQI